MVQFGVIKVCCANGVVKRILSPGLHDSMWDAVMLGLLTYTVKLSVHETPLVVLVSVYVEVCNGLAHISGVVSPVDHRSDFVIPPDPVQILRFSSDQLSSQTLPSAFEIKRTAPFCWLDRNFFRIR